LHPVPLLVSPPHFHLLEQSPSAMCPQAFLTIFNCKYPLPQQRFWNNVQPPSALWCNLISVLCGQRLALWQWMITLDAPHGPTGLLMPNSVASAPGCNTIPSACNKLIPLPLPPGFKLAYLGMQSKLASSLWKRRSITWCKPSFWLGLTTHDGCTDPKS
jgi:hypothetical protein